ncbi:hypothetical protein Tter_0631 [Thermobaculum terrenum ATCC BAA-798]|uniref:Integral membrane protein n=1 Tax=Thermobaculum terrenum (strain ATCC BAA-798 / CCMEE 7001 / YNP1) TaxID=525904 RepID=D1CF42_THET1|nr:hypothetical protein [Thermobaculum terrenum]ACZ41548.1 hypothetical protein Tter_0631 [Thermobaculum terrenum ATCC BAA-798]
MRTAGTVFGIILLIAGVIWALQGAGIIQSSSPMTGQTFWIFAGIITAIVGAVIAYWSWSRRST